MINVVASIPEKILREAGVNALEKSIYVRGWERALGAVGGDAHGFTAHARA